MQKGDGPTEPIFTAPTTASPTVDGAVSKPDIVKQLLSPDKGSEAGVIAQLTSNPFFTAVGPIYIRTQESDEPALTRGRDLDLLV